MIFIYINKWSYSDVSYDVSQLNRIIQTPCLCKELAKLRSERIDYKNNGLI